MINAKQLRDHVVISSERFCNLLALAGALLILLMSFVFQILFSELPCPLCLYQRIGFFGIAFGFLMNMRFGFHPSHYAIVLISSLFTGMVALRQVALHALPDTGAFGEPFLGLHLYTWVFILSMTMIGITSILLGIDRQYKPVYYTSPKWRNWTYFMFAIATLLLLINITSTFLECGLKACPENPVNYRLLSETIV